MTEPEHAVAMDAVSDILARVAHELREPLATMLLWVDVLRRSTDQRAREQAVDAICQSALAQSRVVGDVFDASRAFNHTLSIDRGAVSLSNVLDAAVDAARTGAGARQIRLTLASGQLGPIVGDAARLRQVFDNVLATAIELADARGSIDVFARTVEHHAVIEVRSAGRDIATYVGVGFVIARSLVELHGGTLTGTNSGGASSLTIRIPVADPDSASPHSPRVSVKGKRVLLIDDDSRVRAALRSLLARAGAIVDTADSAAEARHRLAVAPADVLICDITMPDEDGYLFIRSARASGCTIPAIALTGRTMKADSLRAIDTGFDIHLAKPVHFARLLTSIGMLLLAPPRPST